MAVNRKSMANQIASLLTEVALDGLDGATFQAIYTRLKAPETGNKSASSQVAATQESETPLKPPASWVDWLWNVLRLQPNIRIFQLESDRMPLVVFNRYMHLDPELGIVLEPDNVPDDLYPFHVIDDKNNGIKGSCATYHSRKDITEMAKKIEKVDDMFAKFGGAHRVVFVASQSMRARALMGNAFNPFVETMLSAMQWAILERIGRARYLGEVTQGKLSLQCTNENSKSLFYHRKTLIGLGLIKKQVHYQKIKGQNLQGSLFHLPQFFVERRSKALLLIEEIIQCLKNRPPHYLAPYEEVKALLGIGTGIKKLFKHTIFQKYIKGDVRVPYRYIYPDAPEKEWKCKNAGSISASSSTKASEGYPSPDGDKEKTVRVMKLINPDIRLDMIWSDPCGPDDANDSLVQGAATDGQVEWRKRHWFVIKKDRMFHPPKLLAAVYFWQGRFFLGLPAARSGTSNSGAPPPPNGILDQNQWVLNKSLMSTAYKILTEMGPEGISQQMLGKKMGLGKLEARTICRNLQQRGLVSTLLDDHGRQRTTNFVAKVFEKESVVSQELKKEKEKLKEHVIEDMQEDINTTQEVADLNSTEQGPAPSADSQLNPEIEVSDARSSLPNVEGKKRHSLSIKPQDGCVTYRQLRRANTIIKLVRQHKVIDDPTKLFKVIQDNEAREGLKTKMDKKSLQRLLLKLSEEKQIKNIFIKINFKNKVKALHFVCQPNIDEKHTMIQSAVEQAKMKFFMVPGSGSNMLAKSPSKRSTFSNFGEAPTSVGQSLQELQEMSSYDTTDKSKVPPDKVNYSQKYCRLYGLQPKFVRMRELHYLLFYLTRAYDGQLLSSGEKEDLVKNAGSKLDEDAEFREEFRKLDVYSSEIDWKMFIPPLPKHEGWNSGWCLFCDILLRFPLSIFVKIVNIGYHVAGLEEYLSHPIRRHYLMKHLPLSIRSRILHQRKYIFSAHEVATRLCYIGVLQFGPQKLKEKDQVFLYVNCRASLIDTSSCLPSYHQVSYEPGKTYPRKTFTFEALDDVHKYWYTLWDICVSTRLGSTSSVEGEEIVLEKMDRKPAMIKALEARKPEEGSQLDTGDIPGDHLGAAGIDSSMFAHIKRNWSWNSSSSSLAAENKNLLKETRKLSSGETVSITAISAEELNAKLSQQRSVKHPKRKAFEEGTDSAKKPRLSSPATITRVVRSRKRAKPSDKSPSQTSASLELRDSGAAVAQRKPYYDSVDLEALRLMRKLRVDWTSQENSFLLLCKVAGAYLCQNTRNQMVQYTAVRDLLHRNFPESKNKTSRACQRRLNYMMKNPTTLDNVTLYLADIRQDQMITSLFPVPGTISKEDNERRLNNDFDPLVNHLVDKYRRSGGMTETPELPNSPEAVLSRFHIVHPTATIGEPEGISMDSKPTWDSDSNFFGFDVFGFSEPSDISMIRASVVNTLITSSLCSASDKTSWAFQLYKIYQQYPDTLLRGVVDRLRTDKMIALKKQFNRKKLQRGNFIPLSSAPYQLSVTFSHKFLSRYQYDIYSQSWALLKDIFRDAADQSGGVNLVVNQEGGFAATVVGLMARDKLIFRTEVPEQLVVLDPNLSMVDKQYVRMLQRYKELLRKSGNFDNEDMQVLDVAMEDTPFASAARKQQPTVTALFKSPGASDKETSEMTSAQGMERPKGNQTVESDTGDIALDTKEDVIAFKGSSQGSGTLCPQTAGNLNPGEERNINQVAKSASRIALYMLREEMKDGSANSMEKTDATVQHTHDFFVISSCKIKTKLKAPAMENVSSSSELMSLSSGRSSFNIPTEYLPGNVSAAREILKRYGVGINGLSNQSYTQYRRTCLPKNIASFESFLDSEACSSLDALSKEQLQQMYLFICKAKEFGVTGKQISDQWDVMEGTKTTTTKDREPHSKQESKAHFMELDEESVESEEISMKHSTPKRAVRVPKKRKPFTDGIDTVDEFPSDAAKYGSLSEVDVVLRPWIRLDGSLNRRVLDRLLGAILGHIMQKPGQSIEVIAHRFSPALQPAHSLELIDLLAELGCVIVSKISNKSSCGLFRSRQKFRTDRQPDISLKTPSILDDSADLLVEPVVDAIIRLGQFIGDKLYTVDFANQCPCHPDRGL